MEVENQWAYAAKRVVCFLIDFAVFWIVIVGLQFMNLDQSVVVNALVYLLYRGVLGSILKWGTLGRICVGLTLTTMERNGAVSVPAGILRELPIALAIAGPVLGLPLGLLVLTTLGPAVLALDAAFVVSRPDCRSLRDLLAGTLVVRSR